MITFKLNMYSKLSIVHCIKAIQHSFSFLFLNSITASSALFYKPSIQTKVCVCKKNSKCSKQFVKICIIFILKCCFRESDCNYFIRMIYETALENSTL